MCRVCLTKVSNEKRQVAEKGNLWPQNAELNIYFMDKSKPKWIEFLKDTWSIFKDISNLKFNYVDDISISDIRVNFDTSDGSWSTLGRNMRGAVGATMNFSWMDNDVALHEICHSAFSMSHEHQHPETPFEWNYEEIEKDLGWSREMIEWNITSRYNANDVITSDYDPDSIMLYSFPSSWVTNGVGTKWNQFLSEGDIAFISTLYPKEKDNYEILRALYGDKNMIRLYKKTHVAVAKILGVDSSGTEKEVIERIRNFIA